MKARFQIEALEDRVAPAVQIFSGLEFMTAGSFTTSHGVVSSSSAVEVGTTPAQGASFTPLLLLQNGVQFTSTDTTGAFTTPPVGAAGGSVSGFAGGTTVPLLDAHPHTFLAPALLGSGVDTLSSGDTNGADLPVAGAALSVTGLHFDSQELDVQGTLTFANFPGLNLPVTGTDDVSLGNSGVRLTSLNVALPASTDFSEAGLKFKTNDLTVSYDSAADEFDLSGSGSVSVANNSLSITLGNASAPGLVIENGSVQSFEAAITSNIQIGGLTFAANNLTIQTTASSNLTITGTASFVLDVAGDSESVAVTLGSTDSSGVVHPGIVIDQSTGRLVSLDAAVTADLTVAGLDIKADALGVQYEFSDDSFIISGGASFSLDGATVSILLGGTFSPGIVIQGGQLVSLQAAVSGDFDLLGVQITADSLTVAYVAASSGVPAEFDLFGGVGLTSSFVNFNTMLGDEEDPGIVIAGGQLQSLNITVSGGFSLFGIDVTADGLMIQYASATNELELSGGIMLEFTSSFQVSAAITEGGLLINTATGALAIPSSGLQITASANLGPFSIQNLMVSFSDGSSGVNFSASGKVDLPGGIDIGLDELDIVNGQLDDIGLSEQIPIPIGDTGFFIDTLSGSLQNLNNPSQLVVMASAEVSYGEKVQIPNLEPIFAGGSFALIDATGSITVSASQLDLSGTVSLLGGLLGQGSASLDLNWTTGVYTASGNFSMFDSIINYSGSLAITSAGDINLEAMASVNVPPQIPFIGGDSLGSINFFLQYQPGEPLTQDFVGAYTSVNLFFTSITIGFEIDFQGDVSIINGNDVAAITASIMSQPQPSQYVYQQNVSVPSQTVAGSDAIGAQITASSPILDGAYPVTVGTDTISADYNTFPNLTYTSYQLSNPDVILSTLSFGVTVEQDVVPGGIFAGTGSFDSKGNFVFTPSGLTSIVPKGATLYSDGDLALTWAGAPFGSDVTSINATYDAANAYFELLQQSTSGGYIPLAKYSIDPVTNSSTDPVQAAIPAESVATDQGLIGNEAFSEGGAIESQYMLQQGQADQKTVSITLYKGSTLLGKGYFDSSGGFHFIENGTPSLVPTNGFVSTNLSGDGILTLDWPSIPPQTTANVTYASIGNRLIDFDLSNESAQGGVAGQYVIELVSTSALASNDIPSFSESDQYQLPTVSLPSDSVILSKSGVLSGTLLASAYTAAAQSPSDTTTTVSLYDSTTDGTTNGQLIGTYDYSQFTTNAANNPRSFSFSSSGFQNLPAGSYYIYAVINDGQNQPQASNVVGPFTEISPTPTLSVPTFLALTPTAGTEQGVFSAAANTSLGISTNFVVPVTVNLAVSGGGDLVLPGEEPTADLTQTYPSAAAAVAALDGLTFVSDSLTGAAALSITISTNLNGTAYQASATVPLLTPNTHLVVSQSVNGDVPGELSDEILTLTVANPGGPDGQNGTNVQVHNFLSQGLAVLSSSATEGSFDAPTGIWTIGSLPITGANSATLTLTLEASPTARGNALTSTSVATSALFNFPASDATNIVPVPQPQAVTFTVTSLSDSGPGSLRNAIAAAQNGDSIQFAASLVGGTIELTSGELLIDQDLTINGPTTTSGAPGIVISGNGASRVFDIEGERAGINITLRNLAIEDGLATAQAANAPGSGGGILVDDPGGSLSLSHLLISGNVAQAAVGSSASGGGVAFVAGLATLSDLTFSNNQAIGAAATQASNVGLGGALAVSAGNITLITDTIANNQAKGGGGGQGGGLSVSGGSVTLINNTLAGNTATAGGDVYQASPGFLEAINSVFATGTAAAGPDFFGTVGFSDHDLVENAMGSIGFSTASGDLLNINAELGALGSDGGPTPTVPPLPGSPVINAADSALMAPQTIAGLVSWWQADGNALDSEGANDGTVTGGVTYASGVVGQAFQLNGSDGEITVADSATLDTPNFTVGGWFNVSQAPVAGSSYVLASKYDGNYHGWILQLNSGLVPSLSVEMSPGATASATSSQPLSLNTWYFISGSFDGTKATLSIDGIAVANAPLASGYMASATPLVIGAASWYGGGYFAGDVDQVSYFDEALTAAQLRSLCLTGTAASAFSTMTTDQRGDLRVVDGALDIGADEYQYDLSVSVGEPANVEANQPFTETLTVTDNGPDPVTGATLTDILPQGVTFQSLTAPANWTVSSPSVGQSGAVTATDTAMLSPGSSVVLTLVAKADSAAPSGLITTTVSVGPTAFDTNNTNNNSTATSTVITPAPVSNPAPVSPPAPIVTPSRLDFQSSPTNAVIGQAFHPVITVAIVDANGNAVTTDNSELVTLSIASGPAGAALGGTTTALAVNGVATFTNLTLSLAGSYTLQATAGKLAANVTPTITVAPIPVTTGLTIRRGSLHKVGGRRGQPQMMAQTITIRNQSRKALSGPLALELNGLRPGVTLADARGTFEDNSYVQILSGVQSLKPGKTTTITLDFTLNTQRAVGRQALYEDLEALLGL